MSDDFETLFGAPPQAQAQAPGRVNLLGEHTDYNDGFVLPVAIPQQTRVAMRRNGSSRFTLHAAELDSAVTFTLHERPEQHFASYVYGCLRLVRDEMSALPRASRHSREGGNPVLTSPLDPRLRGDDDLPCLDIHVSSDVPMGVGLSSSAALEVATLRCLRQLLNLQLDDVRIAQLAQQAEIEDAGVRCGIMDQMASSLADTTRALLLDTRSLERRFVPLPPDAVVLVLDSGVARTLATSGYNERRAECEEAARLLGVASLREVEHQERLQNLPDKLLRRARHVLSENARVLKAVDCGSARAFGELMNASHASLRDDYEVSTPELDLLVSLLQAQPGVHGARLTGAGFGGACVALCRGDAVQPVAQAVLAQYRQAGHTGKLLVPTVN